MRTDEGLGNSTLLHQPVTLPLSLPQHLKTAFIEYLKYKTFSGFCEVSRHDRVVR